MGAPTHTPGPWRVKSPRVVSAPVTVPRPDGTQDVYERELAHVGPVGSQSPWPGEERRANARLIAAAPELLDAAMDLLALVEGDIAGSAQRTGIVAEARAAIAKAVSQ